MENKLPAKIMEAPGPISVANITAAENQIGLPFPADYRSFLQNHNGGYPMPDSFKVQWNSDQPPARDWRSTSMSWFYGVDDETDSTNLVEANTITFERRFPDGCFAFASDAGGNQLLLAVKGPFAGKVLFWCKDHEVEEGQTPGYDNVGIVADSFQDFLDDKLY